ncbi:type IV toxin-antitoxin system AbiEi family antitoxin domain-containing protein [Actinospica sp. MGRD01-02]|uniref:Type IV toxin-antitoxin system AbiEi family antitoxin domain-containing protein n=1 Tax=Actinospica acidithermotolerans TaxID=2828514 RepID=A0A941II99_9ACTN|nr:type IV toxin-antitoxin system AbiEi family antitoxin domain-containing protein [Actinospica acidithermotolerans]MBR7829410.1 type IV toxin-antitoxin system AbiEi family antitoxin domain-containing protein [Actinospica acidithermotolerans]
MTNRTAYAYDSPSLSTLIERQHGVLTAAQAKAGGLPHETLRRRVQRGLWQRLVPGVYALQGGPPSCGQWLVAAQLYAGDESVLTGEAALAVHGFRLPRDRIGDGAGSGWAEGAADDRGMAAVGLAGSSAVGFASAGLCAARYRLDALVPHGRRRQSVAQLRIIRTTRIPEATRVGVLRVAPPARSVVDTCLAAVADRRPEAIDGVVTAALQDGRVQLAELEQELGKASRRHSAEIRAELAKSRAHARASAAEAFLAKLDSVGPFGALREVTIYLGQRRVARALAVWPSRAVALMMEAPPLESSTLTSLGFAVAQVTSEQLTQDADAVLRHLRESLRVRPEATLSPGLSLLPQASAVQERKVMARA